MQIALALVVLDNINILGQFQHEILVMFPSSRAKEKIKLIPMVEVFLKILSRCEKISLKGGNR